MVESLVALTVDTQPKGCDLVISCAIAASVPTWLMGDANRLRQVLTNLLTNAVRHTSEGHVLLRVEGAPKNGLAPLVLSVEDTGEGIPAERLADIFEEFVQVDGSMSRPHSGVGLGLAISRRIVEAQQGELTVTSELGVGTTFSVSLTFPICPAPENPKATESTEQPRSVPVRVLVVEDTLINQEVARLMLRQAGCRVGACIEWPRRPGAGLGGDL
jgi:signal transduction histidine kinase